MGIITVNRILFKFRTPPKTMASGSSKIIQVFAFLIIFGVFSVVTTNAFFLIKASAEDSHSVFVLTERYINKLDTVKIATPPLTFQKSMLARANYDFTPQTCPEKFKELSAKFGGSLVTYLYFKNLPTSFYDRSILAFRFGIMPYYGDMEQNLAIMAKIARERGDLPELGSMECN